MSRHRALLFGKPLGPWRGSRDLAEQDAIEAGEGSRRPYTGWSYLAVGVTIEEDAGVEPMSPEQQLFGDALAVLRVHGDRWQRYVELQRERAEDADERHRWRAVGQRIRALVEAALRDGPRDDD